MFSKFNIVFEQVLDLLLESIASDIEALEIPEESKSMIKNLKDHNGSPDLKKQKAVIYWISKNILQLPGDEKLLNNILKLFNKKINDYQSVKTKEQLKEIVDSNKDLLKKEEIKSEASKFDPSKEPTFSNPYDAGDGVIIYQVEDSREAQIAVRKAIDKNWGYGANPWCLAARKDRITSDQVSELSEDQKEKLGLYSKRELDEAWNMWERYDCYPKRIAFKNGKLLAFCANDDFEVAWWDREDHDSIEIPDSDAKDDEKFLNDNIFVIDRALDENTPAEDLDVIANHKNEDIRRYVAKNPNTSIKTLERLSKDLSRHVRAGVIANENTPIEIVEKMIEDRDAFVVRSALANSNITPKILARLSEHWSETVRREVAMNIKTPTDILDKLAGDDDYIVRKYIAKNYNTSPKTLDKLSKDKIEDVRFYVAYNKNTPVETLNRLAEDEHTSVSEGAKSTLKSSKAKKYTFSF